MSKPPDPRLRAELDFLQPFFLGPSGENDRWLEELIVEFVRDHAFWRRNFRPEDGHRITAEAAYRPDFLEAKARTREALIRLSAELKRSVPIFHPRYVGHMSSDLLIPGLVARILTTLYNPNNVSEESAPVTLTHELETGTALAAMFGFGIDPAVEPCAWGHLTSGGTVANYEALWNFRAVKFYGIALREGVRRAEIATGAVGPARKELADYESWELLNATMAQMIELRREVALAVRTRDPAAFSRLRHAVRHERIETLGIAEFFARHADVRPPVVLVPSSAHYSWEKGMKVLGLGTAQLLGVAVDDHMRLDPGHLNERLAAAFAERTPVLGVVGVLGTTEFGTVDPIHEIIEARRRWNERGADFFVHVDAAWGGYLASVFRKTGGGFRPRAEMRRDFDQFPSQLVYDAFTSVRHADSVTVDPHKLGFVPYAAGAFVARNREVVDFITQQAAYVFDLGDVEGEVPREQKLRNLGQYILEGSKSGAAATSVAVAHEVLPLHCGGLGRILRQTIRACEHFYLSARDAAERMADRVRLIVPFEPDSNLICLAINRRNNRSLAQMNRFARRVFGHMKVDAGRPVQFARFIGSYTSLRREGGDDGQCDRVLRELGIDPQSFVAQPVNPEEEADHIFILRHTLMNPFLLDGPGERTYIDMYWDFLEEAINDALSQLQGNAGTH